MNRYIDVMTQIDINKSIQKSRLCYKFTGLLILNLIFDNFLWATLITVSIISVLDNYISKYSIIPIIIIVSINIWLLLGLWLKNKLLKISYKDPETNKKIIITQLSQKFPKLKLNDSNSQIITFEREVGLFNWGRTIVIIFANKDIYINYTTLGRNDIKSPFHAPFNYSSLIKIREQIQKNSC